MGNAMPVSTAGTNQTADGTKPKKPRDNVILCPMVKPVTRQSNGLNFYTLFHILQVNDCQVGQLPLVIYFDQIEQ